MGHTLMDHYGPYYVDMIKEELPFHLQTVGKLVIMTLYVDANFYQDYSIGSAADGIIHLVNQTPVDWDCKQQATVRMANDGLGYLLYWRDDTSETPDKGE
jgi:hypothetical protein